jgi:hypothetical protein
MKDLAIDMYRAARARWARPGPGRLNFFGPGPGAGPTRRSLLANIGE